MLTKKQWVISDKIGYFVGGHAISFFQKYNNMKAEAVAGKIMKKKITICITKSKKSYLEKCQDGSCLTCYPYNTWNTKESGLHKIKQEHMIKVLCDRCKREFETGEVSMDELREVLCPDCKADADIDLS